MQNDGHGFYTTIQMALRHELEYDTRVIAIPLCIGAVVTSRRNVEVRHVNLSSSNR